MDNIAKYEDGRLSINVWDLLSAMTGDERVFLVDTLSCQEDVIRHVCAQIVDGYTEDGSAGATSYSAVPHTALDAVKRRIAESASDIAKDEIAKLTRLVESSEKRANEWCDKYHELAKKRGY